LVLEITAIVSAAAVLVGLIFAGQQARAVLRQLRIANIMAGTSELRAVVTVTHPILEHLIANPQLRCYFYENTQLSEDDQNRSTVLSIAEMYCDAVRTRPIHDVEDRLDGVLQLLGRLCNVYVEVESNLAFNNK
jgi:hypothetical protein